LLSLCAYLLGAAKFFPGLLAFAAMLEGSHQVLAHVSESGCELVLHHESRNECDRAVHRHGLASKLICLLAAPSDADVDPDHVLQMANGAVSESVFHPPALSPAGALSDFTGLEFALPAPLTRSLAGELSSLFSVEQHPPPRAQAHLAALRVTMLVI
jgi:hypothetical protein